MESCSTLFLLRQVNNWNRQGISKGSMPCKYCLINSASLFSYITIFFLMVIELALSIVYNSLSSLAQRELNFKKTIEVARAIKENGLSIYALFYTGALKSSNQI